jgi:enterochelin esterase family protein
MASGDNASVRRALDLGVADPRNPARCPNRSGNSLSVVELPDAPAQPWLAAPPEGAPRGRIFPHSFEDGRRISIYEPPEAPAPEAPATSNPPATPEPTPSDQPAAPARSFPALIMFDRDIWLSDNTLPNTLDNLIRAGEIPPLYAFLLETSDIAARWDELSEGSGTDRFITERLLPWARQRYPIVKDAARVIIAGQSLGGLTALRVVLERPERIRNALSQSASLWRGSFMEKASDEEGGSVRRFPGRVYAEVGRQEWVLLPPHQAFARALKDGGADFRYAEYNGGHDYACWRGGVADGLRWLTAGW